MKAELNELEKEMGEMIAKRRYNLNRKNNVKDLAVLGKAFSNGIHADIEGLWAELAFCKVAKVYPDEVFRLGYTSKRKGGDVGDAIVNNMHIDVKSTKTETGRLITMQKNALVDSYVLLIGKEGKYRIAGAMKSSELCVPERFGHHKLFKVPCFMATQDELTPWEKYSNA
tara:strand:- start:53 stop:562 length:510 start_codon:yes stop_codon:yes gene_type:complete